MKKLLISILSIFGLSAQGQTESAPIGSNTLFDKAVFMARETNDFMPVWELFVNTEFYVITVPQDSGGTTSSFIFSIFQSEETKNQPTVIISELLERLSSSSTGEKAIRITGAELIKLLNTEVSILVATSEGGFGIPKELVQWLRESIQNVH